MSKTIDELGGGSVGRAVASDTRDLQFESQLWQILSTNCTFKKKRQKYRKRGRDWPIFKKTIDELYSFKYQFIVTFSQLRQREIVFFTNSKNLTFVETENKEYKKHKFAEGCESFK